MISGKGKFGNDFSTQIQHPASAPCFSTLLPHPAFSTPAFSTPFQHPSSVPHFSTLRQHALSAPRFSTTLHKPASVPGFSTGRLQHPVHTGGGGVAVRRGNNWTRVLTTHHPILSRTLLLVVQHISRSAATYAIPRTQTFSCSDASATELR